MVFDLQYCMTRCTVQHLCPSFKNDEVVVFADQDGVEELDVMVTEYRNNGGRERQADDLGCVGQSVEAFDLVRGEAGWVSAIYIS